MELSFFEGFKAVLRREMSRIRSRKTMLTLGLYLPLASFMLFILLFKSGIPHDLPYVVVDQDNTSLSRQLSRMVDATPAVGVQERISDALEGRYLIEEGTVYGALVIPKGFEKAIYKGEAPEVISYYNNVFLVAGGLVNKDVTMAVRTFSAGININSRMKSGQNGPQALAQAVPVKVDSHIMFNPTTNYFYYLVTTMLPIMLQIFMLTLTVYAIGVEIKEGTAKEWLETSGNHMTMALAGKLFPYFLIFSVVGLFMNTMLFRFYGSPLNGSALMLNLALLFMVVSYQAVGIFITAVTPSLRMGLSISSVYGAIAFSFSGLTFPFAGMPEIGQWAGNIFPFTHYLRIMIDQAFRGAPIQYSLFWLGALVVFWLLPYAVFGRLERFCVDEKYYGKL